MHAADGARSLASVGMTDGASATRDCRLRAANRRKVIPVCFFENRLEPSDTQTQSAIQCLTIDSIFAISAHGIRSGAPNNFKRVFPHSDFSRPGTFCWISLTCRVRNAGGAEQQNSKKPTLSAESRGDPRRAAETLIWRGLEKI